MSCELCTHMPVHRAGLTCLGVYLASTWSPLLPLPARQSEREWLGKPAPQPPTRFSFLAARSSPHRAPLCGQLIRAKRS